MQKNVKNRVKYLSSLALTGLVLAASVSTAAHAHVVHPARSLADKIMGTIVWFW